MAPCSVARRARAGVVGLANPLAQAGEILAERGARGRVERQVGFVAHRFEQGDDAERHCLGAGALPGTGAPTEDGLQEQVGVAQEGGVAEAGLVGHGCRAGELGVWGGRRAAPSDQARVNVKRVYRVMHRHGLLLERRRYAVSTRRHEGKVAVDKSNVRWCSDGFEFRCDDGVPLRVTFALDCCDREAMSWAATTAGHSGDIVRDVMLAAVENRFGDVLHTESEIEWLSDNGSGYTADETRQFAVLLGLKPLTTPVCSPQSNGMAESFVKTMKRDYVAIMPKPDAATAARNI